MRNWFFAVAVLALTVGFSGLAQAQNEKNPDDEVLTAIDVAELINRGSGDADIAELLSSQQGFDRVAARNKGKTDEQIIAYLLTNTKNFDKVIDKSKSIKHRTEGDKYYQESQYRKAAKEYSLVITYSKEDYTPHKLRGDTYKRYLTAELSPSSGSSSDEAKKVLLDKTRALLCLSIYSDYRKSMEIIDDVILKNISDMNMIKFRMEERASESRASPPRIRTAQDNKDIRQLRTLSRVQREANQADIKMKMAISDYKLVCGKEDAARREFLKGERENKREKKWIKYIETEEMSHFYDKSSVAQSEENFEVWARRENMHDEMSYEV